MVFDILAAIAGQITNPAEAERLAHDLQSVALKARTFGCIVQIRDVRLNRKLQPKAPPPQ